MAFLLKDRIHQSLAESVYNEFLSRRANYYYFIGKVMEWDNPLTPETPEVTADYEYDTRNTLLSVKKINVNDISLVVRRINWSSGTIYDQFDGNYSTSTPSASGATKLKDSNFYVLTSQFNVYKCLFNNNGGESTVEPSNFDPTPLSTADGYVWKYLYTIPLSLRNRFLTDLYMPVQRAITNAYYSNGEISSVIIDNAGSGYLGNAEVSLAVNGQFLGGAGNVVANLRPVLNAAGEFIDVLIDSPGNNYKTASITIIDNLGAGSSHNKALSNVRIYSPGAGYFPNVVANTTATIATAGAVQPGANAFANLIFSSNALVDVVIINPGTQYSYAAISNTTITISTTGNSQPSSNASANLYFANSAILTPVLANGQIQSVVINDQGKNYSSNIQTTISIIGNGIGAVLTPFINAAGQLEEVIIEERGSGYTYADISVIGDGVNANAYVNLSVGSLDTIQSVVELSAIEGGVHAFRVHNAGTNYSNANITVSGDGSGFVGNVVLTNNTVNYITVTNPGSGYSYANVTITGSGSNANVTAILSPPGGHGSDIVSELFADAIMFTSTINNEKNQGVDVNNDYRQFGIIKGLKAYNSGSSYTSVIGSACYLLTMDTVSGLDRDIVLTLTIGSSKRYFEIVEVIPATNQLLITNLNHYELSADNVLVDETTDISYTVESVDRIPTINKFSGDLLFIDNRTSVSYSDQQLVTLRTVIKL